jgi:hypothetical protein
MTDKFTGKPIDKASDRLPHPNGGRCETCGTETIDHCAVCGAPQCCPSCCADALAEGAGCEGTKQMNKPTDEQIAEKCSGEIQGIANQRDIDECSRLDRYQSFILSAIQEATAAKDAKLAELEKIAEKLFAK